MADPFVDEAGNHIQAMEVSPQLVKVISVWCGGLEVEEIHPFDNQTRYPAINVPTPEGVKRASIGDHVIKRSDKTFDVVKPNEFQHTYQNWEP